MKSLDRYFVLDIIRLLLASSFKIIKNIKEKKDTPIQIGNQRWFLVRIGVKKMSVEKQNSQDGSVSPAINEIFDSFKTPKIFRTREPLSENYWPNKFPFRETETLWLAKILAPALQESSPSNILIVGPIGTGKTIITKYVLSLLEHRTKEDSSVTPVQFCYVNCRSLRGEYKIVFELCRQLGIEAPSTGISFGELFSRFTNGVDSEKRILIIVLDELDTYVKERGCDLIYNLTRVTLAKSKLSIIGIGNNLALQEWIDAKTLSTLHAETIEFKAYDADQIRSVLNERAKLAFNEGVLKDEVVPLCAALAKAEGGDMRLGLTLLLVAGECAVRNNVSFVTEDYVRKAENNIEYDRTVDILRRLSDQEKITIFSALALDEADGGCFHNGGNFPIGRLYHRYQEVCQRLGIDQLTQRRILQLVSQLAARGLLNTHVASLGRGGRTTKVTLGIPPTAIRNALGEDPLVGRFIREKILFYT